MKSKDRMWNDMMDILVELESCTANPVLERMLQTQLDVYYNSIFDEEDIPEEYWDRIESALE